VTADDRAFVAAVRATPADDLPRLVYADWLDEHDDPRGSYLRAEVEHFRTRSGHRRRGPLPIPPGVDPVWANLVGRPPFGIAVPGLTFEETGPPPDPEFLAELESVYGEPLPADYAAFLAWHNGGVPTRADWDDEADEEGGRVTRFYSSDDPLETNLPALLTPAAEHFEGNFFEDINEDEYWSVVLIARAEMPHPDLHEYLFYLGLRVGDTGGLPRLVELWFHGNTGVTENRFSDLPLTSFADYLAGLAGFRYPGGRAE
jgi:uncharacterized protein (TIGR02996 family)